jgi:nucleoside-diphosphate-sugar epimerase
VRPFNTYGPRQSARAIIPTIAAQLLTRDRLRLGDLRPVRDFTYVSDTVAGMLLAAGADGAEGQEINLGSGHEISIGNLAERLMAIVGRKVDIDQDTVRLRPEASEVGRLMADAARARELLDWSPEVTLDDGLAQVVEWVRAHLDLYRVERYVV